ncbi:MAG: type II toxin-antitoxin system VapC family toxin [Rhodospirillaceae bacterium]|nr:type II toxin-antitoxin system VapC family toxin [Rhodospirillaceae bacterium]MDE0618971.1 type II toxin-antitoxin system VapC family toxin [Rhodospirillaceae bacterium]
MIVLDTHVLIWAVGGDRRLGETARAAIEESIQTDRAAVSAITPWEIAMLVEKGRLRLGREVRSWIDNALALPGIFLAPIEPAIAIDSMRLSGGFNADPADRFIVSTARYFDAPLVTADRAILSYAAAGHVRAMDAAA